MHEKYVSEHIVTDTNWIMLYPRSGDPKFFTNLGRNENLIMKRVFQGLLIDIYFKIVNK